MRALKILVISPHVDDAALSCFSIISIATSAMIVNVFSKSKYTRFGASDVKRVTSDRLKEDRIVWKSFSNVKVQNCGIGDSSFRGCNPFSSNSSDCRLVEKVVNKLNTFVNDFDLMCVPSGCGNHIDHLICRAAGEQLSIFYGKKVIYYADQFYYCYPDKFERSSLYGLADLALNIGDVSCREKKRKALNCYKSQLCEEIISDVINCGEKYYEKYIKPVDSDTGSSGANKIFFSDRGYNFRP